MTSSVETLLEVINVIRNNKGLVSLPAIHAEMKLRDDIGFDSLDLAELTARLYEQSRVDVFEAGLVFTVGEVDLRLRDGRKH